jgi:ABC-type sulfate transport system permease subunit
MLETTLLVVSGKKLTVPRLLKRILQVAMAVALTAAVFLVVIVGNGLLVGRQASLQAGINLWLAFIKRPDILATMVLTALVTVLFVYWQRNQERRAGSADRMPS